MSQDLVAETFVLFFPFVFVGIWIATASLLGRKSGWYRTAATYPDIPGEPILRLRFRSGVMGGVRMVNVMTLAACAPGLRVSIPRVFGPFCRPFLVPWRRISVEPRSSLFGPMVEFRLGETNILTLPAGVAARLARAVGGSWPEGGTIPVETRGAVARRTFIQWALMTGVAAIFFTGMPRLLDGSHDQAPILVTILFPAIVVGLSAAIAYFRDRP